MSERQVQAYFGTKLVSAKKKVYEQDFSGSPGYRERGGQEGQSKHYPPVTPEDEQIPEIWDPEVRAKLLLGYANQIQRETGLDFWRSWILASEQHPELIGSSDGMRKLAPVPEPEPVLPGTNSVTASYTEIGNSVSIR